MPWMEVPPSGTCADCGRFLSADSPCSHFIYRQDDVLGRTYMYASEVRECSCGCGAYIADGNAYMLRSRVHGLETVPLSSIRARLCIPTPEGIDAEPEVQSCDCGRYWPTADMVEVVGRYGDPESICGECREEGDGIVSCRDCGNRMLRSNTHPALSHDDGSEMILCRHCLVTYSVCSHCGRYATYGDHCETNEFGFIDDCSCYDCGRAQRNVIHSYSYRPTLVFAGTAVVDSAGRDRTPYMGFELEVEVPRGSDIEKVALELRNAGRGRIYLKEDGSINNGFEIVTHPATLDWYMSEFPWQKIRDMRRERKIRSDDNCGLHVHVSRTGFDGSPHEYRWFLFWYRNQQIMNLLAGRESSYAAYNPTHRSMFKDIATNNPQASAGRYAAINTVNQHTYEVRVFASTVYVNRIKAALQLVNGTVEYTRQLRSAKVLKDGGFSFDSFIEWMLATGPRRYAELIERLESLTGGQEFHQLKQHTDSWRTYDAYGRSRWVNRQMIIQEKKVAR